MAKDCPHGLTVATVAATCVQCCVAAALAALVWQADAVLVLDELGAYLRGLRWQHSGHWWEADRVAASEYAEECVALVRRADGGEA